MEMGSHQSCSSGPSLCVGKLCSDSGRKQRLSKLLHVHSRVTHSHTHPFNRRLAVDAPVAADVPPLVSAVNAAMAKGTNGSASTTGTKKRMMEELTASAATPTNTAPQSTGQSSKKRARRKGPIQPPVPMELEAAAELPLDEQQDRKRPFRFPPARATSGPPTKQMDSLPSSTSTV
jgi:hypothetical protein